MQNPFKIFEHIYLVGGLETTDERDCCVYLIDGGKELALIDSGLGFSCQDILANIKKLGFDTSRLNYVIATHGHIDHIGGLHFFQDMGAKVIAHQLDTKAISEGIPELTAAGYYNVKYQPVEVDIMLKETMNNVPVGDLVLHCPHTPGHTPGGISPYLDIEGTRILFGQDIHGPFDASWGSDLKKWKHSMEMLLSLNTDILCEGHFGTYQPAEKVQQYIEYYIQSWT